MAYLVNITPNAERDLDNRYDDINTGDSDPALVWFRGLKQAILTLEKHSNRCPLSPESDDLRHLLYGRKPHAYRVIYRSRERQSIFDTTKRECKNSFSATTCLTGVPPNDERI